MRITTNAIYERGLHTILDNQKRLLHTQEQLAKRTKILTAADDPVGKAQTLSLDDKISQNSQFQRNADLLKNQLQRAESIYSGMTSGMDRARVLIASAGNGIHKDQDREAIASELQAIRDELLDLMNYRDENGNYLFSGFQIQTEPFVINGATGELDYAGDQGTNKFQLSPSLQTMGVESGFETFQNVDAVQTLKFSSATDHQYAYAVVTDAGAFSTFHTAQYDINEPPENNTLNITMTSATTFTVTDANGGTVHNGTVNSAGQIEFNGVKLVVDDPLAAGQQIDMRLSPPTQNIVTTLDDMIASLNTPGLPEVARMESLENALNNLDAAHHRLSSVRAQLGGRLSAVTRAHNNNMDHEIANKEVRASISEVDYAEALSRLNQQDTALQAAQATFIKVTRMSLFDLIR